MHGKGVRNIEMESTTFSALTHHAGVRAAILNVALINRLNGDQVNATIQSIQSWLIYKKNLLSKTTELFLSLWQQP